MQDQDFFVDIHTHTTLRAYNTPIVQGKRNHWEKTYNQTEDSAVGRWARLKTQDTLKESQANLYSYARNKGRLLFDSLYPIEKGFLNFRKMPRMVVGQEKADQVLRTVTGIDGHQLNKLRKQMDYFQELQDQYAFLHRGQGASPDGEYAYRLLRNFSEFEDLRRNEPNTLGVVVTIEGAHCFNCGLQTSKKSPGANPKELSENIGTVKAWEYPPFFINLAHHFYNELCGQTRSFKPFISAAYNQRSGLNEGIHELGWQVLHELLATDNGPRVLIDIKHMSVRARREYYRFLETHNRLNPQQRIPVICSHTGINDFETMRDTLAKKDNAGKLRKSDFHNWRINLSQEEIRIIHESGGLIGIMIDKGLLASAHVLEKVKKMEDEQQVKDAFVEIILRNIFGVVKAIGAPSAWDVLALGTDFDGLISHVDPYPDASKLPQLRDDLVEYIERHQYEKTYWYGMEPRQLIQKMFQTNSLDFLRRHFQAPVSNYAYVNR